MATLAVTAGPRPTCHGAFRLELSEAPQPSLKRADVSEAWRKKIPPGGLVGQHIDLELQFSVLDWATRDERAQLQVIGLQN